MMDVNGMTKTQVLVEFMTQIFSEQEICAAHVVVAVLHSAPIRLIRPIQVVTLANGTLAMKNLVAPMTLKFSRRKNTAVHVAVDRMTMLL